MGEGRERGKRREGSGDTCTCREATNMLTILSTL